MLSAISREDQEFSQRINFLVGVEQGCAESQAKLCAARFASHNCTTPIFLQEVVKQAELGRLSTPVDTFEGNKSSSHKSSWQGSGTDFSL